MAAGVTPSIILASPIVLGFLRFSFSFTSFERPSTDL